MLASLSLRDRRTLIVGVAVCATIAFGGRIAPAWRSWQAAAQTRRMTATLELERGREAVVLRDALARAVERSTRSLAGMDTMLIQASSPAEGAAQLASMVGATADDAHVQVGALQIRYDSVARGGLASATIRLSATGDVRGLAALLRGVEAGTPLVIVRELSVSPSDPVGTDEREEQLHVELTVESLARVAPRTTVLGRTGAPQ